MNRPEVGGYWAVGGCQKLHLSSVLHPQSHMLLPLPLGVLYRFHPCLREARLPFLCSSCRSLPGPRQRRLDLPLGQHLLKLQIHTKGFQLLRVEEWFCFLEMKRINSQNSNSSEQE